MPERLAVRCFLAITAIALLSLAAGPQARANDGGQDAEAILARLRELLAATETKVVLVPFPNSRSRILKADGSSDFFLYLERGNLRGTDELASFYAAFDAGDMAGADDVFTRHNLVSMRASDYGWNGLGVPMERTDGSGAVTEDRFYKTVEGVFGPSEVSADDAAEYLEYIQTVLIPYLEGRS